MNKMLFDSLVRVSTRKVVTVLEEDISEPESSFYFIRLTIRRFVRQTVKQLALGLVGILIIFGLGFGSPSVDESAPLAKQFASVQLLQSGQTAQSENRHAMPEFRPDIAQQLGHSRVASSSLLGHRLTGSHLFTQPLSQGVESLTENEAAVALAP